VRFLERRFALSANGTTVQTEVLAGVTTFLTMAYIIFVQPAVLSAAGMDFGAVLTATCLSTALATLLMALLANYPIAVAPAMGHNFFFVYPVVIGMHVPWRVALGAVAIANSIAYLSELLDPICLVLGLTRRTLMKQSLEYLLLGEGETGLLVYSILVRYWAETKEVSGQPLILLVSESDYLGPV